MASDKAGSAAARSTALVRRRTLARLVLGMVPRDRMGGFRSHEQLRTFGRSYYRGLGRDYSDVSPIYGVLLGGAKHNLQVEVDVMPLA